MNMYHAYYPDGSYQLLPEGIPPSKREEGLIVTRADSNSFNEWWCWHDFNNDHRGLWKSIDTATLPVHIKIALATRLITGEIPCNPSPHSSTF